MEDSNKSVAVSESGGLIERAPRIALKHRWVILLTTCGVTLLAIAVLTQIPNQYQSEATLLVVQQEVPERYVIPTTTTKVADTLSAMIKEVLSRRRLLAVIDELGLYSDQRKRRTPEQIVEMMTKDIEIQPLQASTRQEDFNAFRIAYTGREPVTVQKVTSTLTSLFIQENLRTREEQATTTTNFLTDQLQARKLQLDEQEQRLRDFKMRHLGQLPEQQQGNLAILTGLQTQLQNTTNSIANAQQQRVYLESLLNAHLSALASTAGPPGQGESAAVTDAKAEIEKLKASMADMVNRYTARHPDVLAMEQNIKGKEAALEKLKKEEQAGNRTEKSTQTAGSPRSAPTPSPVGGLGEPALLAQLRSQLDANRVQLESLAQEEARLKEAVALYQDRLNATPVREQQLSSVTRETEAVRQEYLNLQKKEQESQLARDLEKNQRGQRFRLVDAPSFPSVPVSPKRLKLSGIAAGAGVALGVLLALILEWGRRYYHTEKQVREDLMPYTPLVMAMPLLLTRREQRRRKWRVAAECCAGLALLVVVAAAEFYVYRFG